MLQQLSIYAENKKGTMQNITEVLAGRGHQYLGLLHQ